MYKITVTSRDGKDVRVSKSPFEYNPSSDIVSRLGYDFMKRCGEALPQCRKCTVDLEHYAKRSSESWGSFFNVHIKSEPLDGRTIEARNLPYFTVGTCASVAMHELNREKRK